MSSNVEDGMGFAGFIGGTLEEREIDLLEASLHSKRKEIVALRAAMDPRTLMAIADIIELGNIHKAADLAERIRIMARGQFAILPKVAR